MNWFKALALIPILAEKIPAMLSDGRVTATESADLLISVAGALGLPLDIDVSMFADTLPTKGTTPPTPSVTTEG